MSSYKHNWWKSVLGGLVMLGVLFIMVWAVSQSMVEFYGSTQEIRKAGLKAIAEEIWYGTDSTNTKESE